MNVRQWLFSGIAVALVVPMTVFAQRAADGGLVPCGDGDEGGYESSCQVCHFVDLTNNVSSWLVGILSVAAAVMFVIAGYRIVTANGNMSTIQSAKTMIVNVAIGFAIVLGAWLIIDFVMRTLLLGGGPVGPWNAIQCVQQPNYRPIPEAVIGVMQDVGNWNAAAGNTLVADCDIIGINAAGEPTYDCSTQAAQCSATGGGTPTLNAEGSQVTCSQLSAGGAVTGGGRGVAQCDDSNPNCNIALLESLGLTPTQARVMSCVAVTENAGGAVGCSGTGPCGTFQITRTNWRLYTEGGGASFPECAASNFGGNLISAQNNGPCNAKVMTAMVRDSGYQPWTGNHAGQGPWNPNARTCVRNYSNASDPTYRAF